MDISYDEETIDFESALISSDNRYSFKLKSNILGKFSIEFENVWFYRQIKISNHYNSYSGIYKIIDDHLIELLSKKSYGMLPVDLAERYVIICINCLIELVVLKPPIFWSSKRNSIGSSVFELVEKPFVKEESALVFLSNYFLKQSYDYLSSSVIFDGSELFDSKEDITGRIKYPLIIEFMEINHDIRLRLMSDKDKKHYEVYSSGFPEYVQIVDELIYSSSFQEIHKVAKNIGPMFFIKNSDLKRKLKFDEGGSEQIRIESGDDIIDIIDSNFLIKEIRK